MACVLLLTLLLLGQRRILPLLIVNMHISLGFQTIACFLNIYLLYVLYIYYIYNLLILFI